MAFLPCVADIILPRLVTSVKQPWDPCFAPSMNSTNYRIFLACTFCSPNSNHVTFSREFVFCRFVSYTCISTWIRRHLKETVLWGNITLPEMGKTKHISLKGLFFIKTDWPIKEWLLLLTGHSWRIMIAGDLDQGFLCCFADGRNQRFSFVCHAV